MQLLLDAGADPELRTRIDECETPLEMAEAAGLSDIAAILARKGQPLRRRLRSGLVLLLDIPGGGEPVRRQHKYRIRLRLALNNGEAVRWQAASGEVGASAIEDHGQMLFTVVRIDRRSLANGLFYGVEGMRVGGTRRLEIAPHLAYGAGGVPGVIPPHAMITAERRGKIARAADRVDEYTANRGRRPGPNRSFRGNVKSGFGYSAAEPWWSARTSSKTSMTASPLRLVMPL